MESIELTGLSSREYEQGGKTRDVVYGFHSTPLGECLVAVTEMKICWLAFVTESREAMLTAFSKEWGKANCKESAEKTACLVEALFANSKPRTLPLLVKGTDFQRKVWNELLHIPQGGLSTYKEVAVRLGNPKMSCAVGQAVGANAIAWLIPCHRVIHTSGAVGNYRWGAAKKQELLAQERI